MNPTPKPPKHLTGAARDLFSMIVEEMVNVDLRPSDAISIEGLAVQLARLRSARKQARAGGDVSVAAKEIEADSWQMALMFSKDLLLSDDALKRLAWAQ